MAIFCPQTRSHGFTRTLTAFVGLLLGLGAPVAQVNANGLDAPTPLQAFLNGVFPSEAPTLEGYTQRDYFPEVRFTEPLRIVEHPSLNELVIVGKDGKGHLISNFEGATDKREFFNIQPIMHGNPGYGEGGISDMVFHPNYATNGASGENTVFISYWWSPDHSGTFDVDNGIAGYNRLSRFVVIDNQVDLNTEEVLINQYDRQFWHIGMDMQFGTDGLLYISVGDETPTTCCARADTTQRLDGGLWSGILRIDVDNDASRSHPIRRQPYHPGENPQVNGSHWPASFTQGYSIPNDNPFVSADGSTLEEFYSIGLRHPWTISIDQHTGDIWAADVGRFRREEINRIAPGDNHQWPFREGNTNGPDRAPNRIAGVSRDPVWDYPHSVGSAVIGAGVYRGSVFPELQGKYLFSDFVEGPLWTATTDGEQYQIEQIGTITSGSGGIVSYLLADNGQILMARSAGPQQDGGRIDALTQSYNTDNGTLPQRLSDTSAFSDLTDLSAIDSCIPYDLNVPFWSDGALKYRWICLPNDGIHNRTSEEIVFSENGVWDFPSGTVFIKHFAINAVENDPLTEFNLETRFTVVTDEGSYGLSYRWNEEQTDADLVGFAGDTRLYSQQTSAGIEQRIWEFPGRADCQTCHGGPAGVALGLNSRQLNRNYTYSATGRTNNQLATFNALGMFDSELDTQRLISSLLTSAHGNDTSASLSLRARSYLDANCAYCHQPGGVRANFDARLTTPLAQQNLINGELLETYDIPGEVVIAPGGPAQSIAMLRASRLDLLAMPPIAKNRVDTEGIALLDSWIRSMGQPIAEQGNDCDIHSTANQITLSANQWHSLTLPCALPDGATIDDVFGDDFSGTYGHSWTLYTWDPTANPPRYSNAAITDTLLPGQGFWLLHITGRDRTVDLPVGSKEIPRPHNRATEVCATSGCASVALSGRENSSEIWNLIGNPLAAQHSPTFDALRVATDQGPCSDNDGCSLSEAARENVARDTFYHFNGTMYETVGAGSLLPPWQGFWVAELPEAELNEPYLVVPY